MAVVVSLLPGLEGYCECYGLGGLKIDTRTVNIAAFFWLFKKDHHFDDKHEIFIFVFPSIR